MTEDGGERSLYRLLEANARDRAAAAAYRAKRRGVWKTWSWADVQAEVVRLHQLLLHAGVKPADLVAVSGECEPRLYWYVLALQRLGAVPVLLSSRASEVEFALAYEKIGFSLLIAGSETQVDVAVQARRHCPKLRLVLALDRGLEADSHDGFVGREDELAAQATKSAGANPLAAHVDTRAVVLSGYDEAGESVFAAWSHDVALNAARQFASATGLRSNDQLVTFLPIAWLGDFLQFSAALTQGALVSAVENAATLSQDLQRLAPDILLAPVAAYRKIMAQTEADITRSWSAVRWLYGMSRSLARRRGGNPIALGLVRSLFRRPLRNMMGLSRARLALCAEGAMPSDLLSFFDGLDVKLKALDLDARYGGVLALYGHDAKSFKTMPGIKFVQDAQGDIRCVCERPAMGILEAGGHVTPIDLDCEGGPVKLPGRPFSLDDVRFDELNDMQGSTPRETIAMRRHLSRLNLSLPVRHAILRKDGAGGLVVIIDPDTDHLRTLAADSGADYRDLIGQPEILFAVGEAIAGSNAVEAQAYPNAGFRIVSFAFVEKPLSAGNGLTGSGGLQDSRVKELLPFAPVDADSAHRIARPLHIVGDV